MIGREREAVGQLVGVQNGAPTSGAANDVLAEGSDSWEIHVGRFLPVAERQARRRPGVEAKCGCGLPRRDCAHDGLVYGHIVCAGRRNIVDQAPLTHCVTLPILESIVC